MLYFQCDLQRQCCNKLYYFSEQKSFIPVNFDGSYAIASHKNNHNQHRNHHHW
jgi:hypothetical protein